MAAVEVKRILNLIPELLEIPYSRIWTTYDKEAKFGLNASKRRVRHGHGVTKI